MSGPIRIRLDRTLCDGFGICAKHAPEYFSLDDWGYASLIGNGMVPEADHDAVKRALFDCPVNAIIEMSDNPGATNGPNGAKNLPVHTGSSTKTGN